MVVQFNKPLKTPASIAKLLGFKLITSCLNRMSICDVVCQPIPLLIKLLLDKNSAKKTLKPSVIESPINTASGELLDICNSFSWLYLPISVQSKFFKASFNLVLTISSLISCPSKVIKHDIIICQN